MKNQPLLTIHELIAGYGPYPVIKGLSLELQEGTMYVLMGPNGAGKSTLLKSVFNLTQIKSGSVRFLGEELVGKQPHELLKLGVAFVSQGRVNFSSLTVEENLRLGAHLEKDTQVVEERLSHMYEVFPDLKTYAKERAFALSGGQGQMLAMARALMSSPRLLLLDEPTLGLSPKLVKEMFALIDTLRKEFGVTIVIVEHNIKSLLDIADYGYVLVEGKIKSENTCAKLKVDPVMQKVFVGEFE